MATTKNKTTQTNQPANTHIDIISRVSWGYCGACHRLCLRNLYYSLETESSIQRNLQQTCLIFWFGFYLTLIMNKVCEKN